MYRCVCTTGLCHAVNRAHTARSRLLAPSTGRSRLWFEVHDFDGELVQRGHLDLYLAPDGSGNTRPVSGYMYADPSWADQTRSLNWFRFAPLAVQGTFSPATRQLRLSKVQTDAALHPAVDVRDIYMYVHI